MGLGLSQGPGQGLGGGRAAGARPPGTPEENTYKRERLRPKELSARGLAVGSLVSDGPTPTGEATIQLDAPELREILQGDASAVEKETLPVEHRKHVESFYEILLGGGSEGGSEGASGGAASEE